MNQLMLFKVETKSESHLTDSTFKLIRLVNRLMEGNFVFFKKVFASESLIANVTLEGVGIEMDVQMIF
jgi:hypothetical protein